MVDPFTEDASIQWTRLIALVLHIAHQAQKAFHNL